MHLWEDAYSHVWEHHKVGGGLPHVSRTLLALHDRDRPSWALDRPSSLNTQDPATAAIFELNFKDSYLFLSLRAVAGQ